MLNEFVAAVAIATSLLAHPTRTGPGVKLVSEKPRHDSHAAASKAEPSARKEDSEEKDGDSKPRGDGLVWDDGPSIRLGRFARINFRAKFQQDIRRPYEGVMTDEVGTMLSRRRLGFEGTLFGHFDFEIEREFFEAHLTADELDEGAASKSKWKDVSLDIDYTKAARVRLGRFKIPFGRDELTSVTRGDFVYRSLGADYLAPSRDVGIMAHGRFFNRALTYSTGIFKHDGDNARGKRSQGADRTYAARLTGRPLRHVDGLELGAAFSTSALSNDSIRPNGLRGRTVMSEDPFFDAVYVNGRRRRWETDLEWQAGAASLRAEYTQVIDQRRGQGLSAQDLPDALYTAHQIRQRQRTGPAFAQPACRNHSVHWR
jgi:hypothetical protein